MGLLSINKFKGLRQDIDYPDLPLNYCHTCTNLDVDDKVGQLTVREGYSQKYSDTFTSLRTAYEYYFEKSGDTKLLINDNGTLKVMTNGGTPSTLTLPTGATIESGFINKFLGYKDHVIITTGNGATNYPLWYGYIKRVAASNTGIFGNAEEFTGYKLLKSQLICPNGVFSSNINNIVYLDSYYYVSFINSGIIEKRDTDFHLVEKIDLNVTFPEQGYIYQDGSKVCLATDGTYLYIGWDADPTLVIYAQVDPGNGMDVINSVGITETESIIGICTDGTNHFILTDVTLYHYTLPVNLESSTAVSGGLDVTCDDELTLADGYVYVMKTGEIDQRSKDDITAVDHNNTSKADFQHCIYYSGGIYVSSLTGDGHVYLFDADDVSGTPADYSLVDEPTTFVFVGGIPRVLSSVFGTIESINSANTYFPRFMGINVYSVGSGDLDAGTYFYKFSVIDQDGQEYTLSDPIFQVQAAGSGKITLRLMAHTDDLDYFYRIKTVRIYRAYSSTGGAKDPDTDYKFLVDIDMNSAGWTADADQDLYYHNYADNQTEALISSTTYEENTGVLDTIKPRYINYKYLHFINDRLHVANFSHDGDDYPNRLIYSPDNAPDAISFYNYYDFEVGDGDAIKGLISANERIIAFKERKFKLFYAGIPEGTYFPGISSETALFNLNDDIFFGSEYGIYVFNGREAVNIKNSVVRLVDTAASNDYIAIFFFENKNRLIFSYRNDFSVVFNTIHKTWVSYGSTFAFRGYFKNKDNQYIGFDQTKFYRLFYGNGNDAEDVGGGNGNGIAIVYDSPLMKFNSHEGEIVTPVSHRHRFYKNSDTINAIFYSYSDGVKTTIETKALDEPSGSDFHMKPYFFDREITDAISYRLSGTVTGGNFKYAGISIEFLSGGYWNV